jgi:hypothetical protein
MPGGSPGGPGIFMPGGRIPLQRAVSQDASKNWAQATGEKLLLAVTAVWHRYHSSRCKGACMHSGLGNTPLPALCLVAGWFSTGMIAPKTLPLMFGIWVHCI